MKFFKEFLMRRDFMRQAFTMIELVFVIVILGILAAVALPKLVAARDDAEVAKFAQNVALITTEIVSYGISQGKYADDILSMTNYRGAIGDGKFDLDGVAKITLTASGKKCLHYEFHKDTDKSPLVYYVLSTKDTQADSRVCKAVTSMPILADKIARTFEYNGVKINGNIISMGESIK